MSFSSGALESNETDPYDLMNKIEREMTKVKYKDDNKTNNEMLNNLQKQKILCKNDDDLAKLNDDIAGELEKV